MCKYCSEDNTERNLIGHDHIVYDKSAGFYYIFIYFSNRSMGKIIVDYCPKCGRPLKNNLHYGVNHV